MSVGIILNRDAGDFSIFIASLLASGLGIVLAGRKLARWEDDHGVEVLRARRGHHGRGLYVRPRSIANATHRSGVRNG